MHKYLLKRLLSLIPVLFVVSLAIFLLIHLVPGDPAAAILGEEASPEQIAALKEEVAGLRQKGDTSKEKIDALTAEREEKEAESGKLRLLERNKTTEREQISGELARLEERKANMLRDYDDTVNKLFDEYELTRREAAEVAQPTEDPTGTRGALSEVRQQIKALGSVNVGAIEEYKEVSERYEFLTEQVGDVERSKKELLDLIEELTGNMSKQFAEQFARINKAFGSTFSASS